ncbi:MAG: glycosyltransferase family 4 protein [Candidatus Omnitrophota bacterium]
MKIIFISPETLPVPPTRGGAVEAWIFEIMIRLPKSFKIYCLSIYEKKLSKYEKKENITYYRFKPGVISKLFTLTYKLPFKRSNSYLYWLPYSFWCAWKIRRLKPDIIHIHNRIQFVPVIKFLNPKSKIILHIHQLAILDIKRVWNSKILRKIDLLIGCSMFLAKETKKKLPGYQNIVHIYNGYDQNRFMPHWLRNKEREVIREKFKITRDEKVILYVGRIAQNKGIHLLIEALTRIIEKNGKVRLVIVGGASPEDAECRQYFSYIKRLARKSANDKVMFTDKIPYEQIDRYYLLGDILVIPSIVKEGLGNIAIEAMATGIPVLASANGGLLETVRHGENGLVVSDVEDIEALAKNIERLIADDKWCLTLGKNGYEFVSKRFNWDVISKEIQNAYCSLMRNSKPALN